jgi:hypothetical protein
VKKNSETTFSPYFAYLHVSTHLHNSHAPAKAGTFTTTFAFLSINESFSVLLSEGIIAA